MSMPLLAESIGDLLRANAARRGQRAAVLIPTPAGPANPAGIETITHGRLLELAENTARWLAARAGPGERIALWSRNAFDSVVLQHACALSGTIIAPFNTGWSDAEAAHALALTRPALAFAGLDNRGADLLARAAALASCPVHRLDEVALIAAAAQDHPLPPTSQSTPFLIQFTSGTTGKAKGALLSQRAALLGGWLRPTLDGIGEDDLWLNAVPYHHVGGSCAIILGALSTGSAFVMLERYDREQLVALMTTLRPTRMGGVPTMWHDILAAETLPPHGTVRFVTLGGASVPGSLVMAVRERLGAHCVIGFGQSECPVATGTLKGSPLDEICDSVGRAVPHTAIAIVDREGRPVPFGETGEICVRSPAVMDGYWDNPEATATTITADGFLHTGDLGTMEPDGLVRIRGRLREVIIRGGENVYPPEIEAVLHTHPAVAMAAVVGVDHQRLGQDVAAVIQLRPGATAQTRELEDFVEKYVARFKVPRHWHYVEAMPMTVSGKIRKVELEQLFGQEK
ncbi:class I adenylate-forming enzyme family protein [Novosphingobium bradum]|uniref:Class I adenylate-forming enzyme family protein n=1 Tax=Novosphingobium bradum TaxID=1737444 RepID=A0ABV7IPE6_9SPHN